jgi:hypothetical protein
MRRNDAEHILPLHPETDPTQATVVVKQTKKVNMFDELR